jgi:hypothetical protein
VTTVPPLDEKVVLLARALQAAKLPYAFGGAIALGYYAVPRVTIDVDINVFIAPKDVDVVVAAFRDLDVTADDVQLDIARRDGQVRLRWGLSPVDLFFAYDKFHFNAAKRVRVVPFGPDDIPILAGEDLMVCKIVFDRRKDWLDIEQMLLLNVGVLDLDDVRRWVTAIVGADDARLARFERAVTEVLGA